MPFILRSARFEVKIGQNPREISGFSKKSEIRDQQINSEIRKKPVSYNDICILVEKNADIPIIENELNYLVLLRY